MEGLDREGRRWDGSLGVQDELLGLVRQGCQVLLRPEARVRGLVLRCLRRLPGPGVVLVLVLRWILCRAIVLVWYMVKGKGKELTIRGGLVIIGPKTDVLFIGDLHDDAPNIVEFIAGSRLQAIVLSIQSFPYDHIALTSCLAVQHDLGAQIGKVLRELIDFERMRNLAARMFDFPTFVQRGKDVVLSDVPRNVTVADLCTVCEEEKSRCLNGNARFEVVEGCG